MLADRSLASQAAGVDQSRLSSRARCQVKKKLSYAKKAIAAKG